MWQKFSKYPKQYVQRGLLGSLYEGMISRLMCDVVTIIDSLLFFGKSTPQRRESWNTQFNNNSSGIRGQNIVANPLADELDASFPSSLRSDCLTGVINRKKYCQEPFMLSSITSKLRSTLSAVALLTNHPLSIELSLRESHNVQNCWRF